MFLKKHINKVEAQTTNWKEIFAMYIIDQGLERTPNRSMRLREGVQEKND